jgi:hypothetical protein
MMTNRLAILALAVMTLAAAPQSLKAADALCPLLNATKHGTYGMSGTGTVAGVGLVAFVGETIYDGHGNSSTTATATVNGTIYRGGTVTGTYTVNPDCTGSVVQSNGNHYDFWVTPDGSMSTWIESDTGTVVTGSEHPLTKTE